MFSISFCAFCSRHPIPPDSAIRRAVGSGGSFHPAPEPATIALTGVGDILLIATRLRRSETAA